MRAFSLEAAIEHGIRVRQAKNDDGPEIGALAASNGFHFAGADWTDIEPSWLVAEAHGRIVAAVQYLFGKPIARVEMLVMDLEISRREGIFAMLALYTAAFAVARGHGVSAVSGMVADDAEIARRILEEHFGGGGTARGTIYYLELA